MIHHVLSLFSIESSSVLTQCVRERDDSRESDQFTLCLSYFHLQCVRLNYLISVMCSLITDHLLPEEESIASYVSINDGALCVMPSMSCRLTRAKNQSPQGQVSVDLQAVAKVRASKIINEMVYDNRREVRCVNLR